ncbi:hypothetical protein NKG05_07430 [Oerskovia sp. M15]
MSDTEITVESSTGSARTTSTVTVDDATAYTATAVADPSVLAVGLCVSVGTQPGTAPPPKPRRTPGRRPTRRAP